MKQQVKLKMDEKKTHSCSCSRIRGAAHSIHGSGPTRNDDCQKKLRKIHTASTQCISEQEYDEIKRMELCYFCRRCFCAPPPTYGLLPCVWHNMALYLQLHAPKRTRERERERKRAHRQDENIFKKISCDFCFDFLRSSHGVFPPRFDFVSSNAAKQYNLCSIHTHTRARASLLFQIFVFSFLSIFCGLISFCFARSLSLCVRVFALLSR